MNFVINEPRINPSTSQFDIIKFWHVKRDDPNYKDLYQVSEVVYGAPSTQVKVERDFSAFALIYNHLRTCIDGSLLNAIFVLKFNLDLISKVNFFSSPSN